MQVYAKIADMSEWQSWLDKDYKAKSHTTGMLSSGDGFHYTVGPNRVNATVIQANPDEVMSLGAQARTSFSTVALYRRL